MKDSIEYTFNEITSELNLQPGDKVLTELNGKSIKLCAKVNTKNGVRNIGGEIDILIARADGSFEIVDLKSIKAESLQYVLKEGSPTYRQYAVQLNCYRSLFKTLFPDADIKSIYVMPVLTERSILMKNGQIKDRSNSQNPFKATPSEGDTVVWRHAGYHRYLVSVNLAAGVHNYTHFINVPSDPRLSGIADPEISKEMEERIKKVEEDAKEAKNLFEDKTEQSETTTPGDKTAGGVDSYRELFEKYLGDNAKYFSYIYDAFDGNFTEEINERMLEDNITSFEKYQDTIQEKVLKQMEDSSIKLSKTIKSRLKLSNKKYDESLVDELATAVKQRREVRGDDGVKIC